MILILAGIPGSGKSTVLNVLKSEFPSINIVNYGEMMLQEAALQGLERDTIRKLPIEQQLKIGLSASNKISQTTHPLTIVDTHACIKTPIGFCPGISLPILNSLNPKGFILVHSSPLIILERRKNDQSRKRDNENVSDLALHQELTRTFLVSASILTGAVLCIVNNDSEDISENMQPLRNFIESISQNSLLSYC